MKVLLPVQNISDAKHSIADGFHNSEFVCIYNCKDKSFEWLPIAAITKKPGNLSLELKRKGITSVISNSMPFMALSLFMESGLSIFKANGISVDENIQLFLNNKLTVLSSKDTSMPSGCSSSCSSCSSSCN